MERQYIMPNTWRKSGRGFSQNCWKCWSTYHRKRHWRLSSKKNFWNQCLKYLFNIIPLFVSICSTASINNVLFLKVKNDFFQNFFFSAAIIEWNKCGLKYLQFKKLEFLQQTSFGISISLYARFYCSQAIHQSNIKARQRLFATEKIPSLETKTIAHFQIHI